MPNTTLKNDVRLSKQSGFTLVELLVVIAIIGVLAAVGTQAYTGYTASAKIKASEANFANVKLFISAELAKCASGGALSNIAGNTATVPDCAAGTPTIAALGTHFVGYFSSANAGVKNPHKTGSLALSTTAGQVGAIAITTGTSPNSIIVKGWPDPATLSTPMTASIAFE